MKRNIITFIALIGFIGLFSNCEKEGTELTMKESVTAPTLQLPTSLALTRDNGTDTLTFVGTSVDPGFTASAKYYLEACPAGDNFETVTEIYNGDQATAIKITVSDLNQILLKAFPEDATSSIDFRLRSILTVDAGTGAPGTGSEPFEYNSATMTADVTLFGLLRLDLINSGVDQKVVSPLGDGNYKNYVKLNSAQPFTLFDPETNTTYGGSGGTLVVDGTAITPPDGWNELSVNINDLTYTIEQYTIGLIGSAVPPYDWSVDIDMDYDLASGTWQITQDLLAGEFKFRKNDGWAWNLGGTEDNLVHNGDNIPLAEDGNYTIILTITSDADETGTFTITKN